MEESEVTSALRNLGLSYALDCAAQLAGTDGEATPDDLRALADAARELERPCRR